MNASPNLSPSARHAESAGKLRFRPALLFAAFLSTLGMPALLAEPLTARSNVTLAPDGVLLIENHRVFPITLTIIPPPGSTSPAGRSAYEEFYDGGISFMRTGGPKWDEEMLEKELDYQQAAARAGVRCAPWLGWALSNIKPGDVETEKRLREVIARLKDSPGLGVWKGADEPEWGKVPPEEVANTARIIHEEDPGRPIWIVQAPRGTVDSMKQYDDGWDIGGIDIYPVSYPPGRHTIGSNKELSMVGDFTRMIREVAGSKPYWMTLQIAFSGTVPPKGIIRFPTFFEQRFMAYEAIINGSRGLVFFGGGLLPTLNERDRDLGWNWTYWERVMKPLLREIGAHSPLQAALTAPNTDHTVTVTGEKARGAPTMDDPSVIEFLVREVGDDFYFFACKKEGPTIKVKFSGLPEDCGRGEVLFEEPREVLAEEGSFTDWFGPNDVHVYRFRRNR